MDLLPLDGDDIALVQSAANVIRANFETKRHTVGAAVRSAAGHIFTGVNIDASGYGPCAEPVALGAAIAHGEGRIVTVVAVAGPDGHRILPPCGNCRQLLIECAPEAMVILPGEVKAQAADLLPTPFRGGGNC